MMNSESKQYIPLSIVSHKRNYFHHENLQLSSHWCNASELQKVGIVNNQCGSDHYIIYEQGNYEYRDHLLKAYIFPHTNDMSTVQKINHVHHHWLRYFHMPLHKTCMNSKHSANLQKESAASEFMSARSLKFGKKYHNIP